MALASCAGGTATGTGGASGGPLAGLQNPFAGLNNPFSGAGAAGVDPDLRGRIGGPFSTAGSAGATAATGAVTDPFAGQGVKQPDVPQGGTVTKTTVTTPAATTPTGAATTTTTTTTTTTPGRAPTSHTVAAGETAWSIARKYGVSVNDLASANALPADTMTVRTGQKLAIPGAAATASTTAQVTAPGVGSPTPRPPSASRALPREDTTPASAKVDRPSAPDLGATRTAASGGKGKLQMPVTGSIVRAYSKGKNEGIDLSAPTGTPVKAAGSGTVAAITRDTDGVPIVVMRHDGELMTVYAGLDNLSVAKGDKVSAGQAIGKSSKSGVLHFEVRQGFESVDPESYLR
ncbi:LysM peptidoglycan-binding domain-containing protein [Paracoccus suum]|uniref:LysM peptidoglycan-binding domain-containing protein n=2 Tax=Paracoccus suum TaxID=2259340 RepID=A0A344PP17_9RHOB|nr:LysM peptidoglycan-binding domain-containing protein [Paracoccus suum]